MDKISPVLCGVAGEFFVAAELSRRGYIASITLRNSKGIDILASNQEATRQVGIQVKSNQGSRKDWILNQKAEEYYADNLYYVFVNLKLDLSGSFTRPDYFIVPSKVVADQVRENHRRWLSSPGRRGQDHQDTRMRKFDDFKNLYLDKWELLGL